MSTPPSTGAVLALDHVSLTVGEGSAALRLLDNVSLEVGQGEALAIVGESGSGKSMTLRAISRLLPPDAHTTGAVTVKGTRVESLRSSSLRAWRQRTIGMIFQDPRSAINPLQRIGDFMLESARDTGQDMNEARRRAVQILRRMGIDDVERRLKQHPHELSGGMLQRVMIASVLLAGPDIILADEPTTALDVTTQSDVLSITEELRRERGMAMLFVTHDLDLAMSICDRVLVLYAGRVLEVAEAARLRTDARHPYTRGLLDSRPPLDRRLDLLPAIPGSPIASYQVGTGCPFEPRCQHRMSVCDTSMPAPVSDDQGWVRCHLVDSGRRAAPLAGALVLDSEGEQVHRG